MSIAIANSAPSTPIELSVEHTQSDFAVIVDADASGKSQVSIATTAPQIASVEPKKSAESDAASAPVKRAYPAPVSVPTQNGPAGTRFDFNDGARVVCPASEHPWKIRLRD